MIGWICGGLLGLAVGIALGHKFGNSRLKSAIVEINRTFDESIDQIKAEKITRVERVVKHFQSIIRDHQHRELLYIGFLCQNGHKEVAERIGNFSVEITVDD